MNVLIIAYIAKPIAGKAPALHDDEHMSRAPTAERSKFFCAVVEFIIREDCQDQAERLVAATGWKLDGAPVKPIQKVSPAEFKNFEGEQRGRLETALRDGASAQVFPFRAEGDEVATHGSSESH